VPQQSSLFCLSFKFRFVLSFVGETFQMAEGQLVLVTGGTGYIANYCIRELLERGYRVRTTVRSLTSKKVDILKSGCETEHADKIEIVVANLASDEGWTEAAAGCNYVMHTASPVGDFGKAKKEDYPTLIEEAIQGTLRALRGAAASGVCKRVVVTSSVAAIMPHNIESVLGKTLTEDDWADPKKSKSYQKSKVMAEKAGWAFCKENNLEMVTVHPCYVIGPSMSALNRSASLDTIDHHVLKSKKKQQPMRLPIPMPFVDVRDTAKVHVEAMLKPGAKNRRYICHAKTVHIPDLLKHLALIYPIKTTPPGTCSCTKCSCTFCCMTSCVTCCPCCLGARGGKLKYGVAMWGKEAEMLSNSRSIDELGITYRDMSETLKDHSQSWHDHGMELAPWVCMGLSPWVARSEFAKARHELFKGSSVAPTGEQIGR
jgi:nucleoside-diphosphate-sugar epimerase